MNNIIVPIIGLSFTFLGAIAYFIIDSKNKKNNKTSAMKGSNISQFFINIMDIKNDILYGLDGYKRIFIELEGICIELLNNNDINRLIKELSSEISKLNIEFDLFAISRPFNIDLLKQQYEDEILNAKTDIQRTLLRNSLKQILEFGENGEVTERKFYLLVQGLDTEPEIIKQAERLIECFKSSNLTCYRLRDNEIKRLINLFNNIATYNYDNMNETINSIPVVKMDLKKEKTIDEKLKDKLEQENNSEVEDNGKENES